MAGDWLHAPVAHWRPCEGLVAAAVRRCRIRRVVNTLASSIGQERFFLRRLGGGWDSWGGDELEVRKNDGLIYRVEQGLEFSATRFFGGKEGVFMAMVTKPHRASAAASVDGKGCLVAAFGEFRCHREMMETIEDVVRLCCPQSVKLRQFVWYRTHRAIVFWGRDPRNGYAMMIYSRFRILGKEAKGNAKEGFGQSSNPGSL